jgi:hypothetical protein
MSGAMESVNFDQAAGHYGATRALPAAAMERLTGVLAADLRARAAAEGLPLEPAHAAETAVRCLVFELRS